MNYRHAYHAGNFADVLKHAALVSVLLHLRKKETPFAVIDTHAGRGLYDLASAEAAKTGEAKDGVLRLLDAGDAPGALGDYLSSVGPYLPETYPGSPLIAAEMLRAQDRLIAIEKHADECALLTTRLEPYARARVIEGDGYAELPKLLPPAERRGLVLIDPPFEETNEFERAGAALVRAHGKFATGIYLLWYPVKVRGAVERMSGELINAGIAKLLRVELDIGRASDTSETALSATGLLVVNPPYGFGQEMETILPYLRDRLRRGMSAKARVEHLVPES